MGSKRGPNWYLTSQTHAETEVSLVFGWYSMFVEVQSYKKYIAFLSFDEFGYLKGMYIPFMHLVWNFVVLDSGGMGKHNSWRKVATSQFQMLPILRFAWPGCLEKSDPKIFGPKWWWVWWWVSSHGIQSVKNHPKQIPESSWNMLEYWLMPWNTMNLYEGNKIEQLSMMSQVLVKRIIPDVTTHDFWLDHQLESQNLLKNWGWFHSNLRLQSGTDLQGGPPADRYK